MTFYFIQPCRNPFVEIIIKSIVGTRVQHYTGGGGGGITHGVFKELRLKSDKRRTREISGRRIFNFVLEKKKTSNDAVGQVFVSVSSSDMIFFKIRSVKNKEKNPFILITVCCREPCVRKIISARSFIPSKGRKRVPKYTANCADTKQRDKRLILLLYNNNNAYVEHVYPRRFLDS